MSRFGSHHNSKGAHLRCLAKLKNRAWQDLRPALLDLPPKCECGALARPGVVWFGEGLPEDVWREAVAAARACDVFLLVGTSAVVYPAAGLAELARSHGAKVIEINIRGNATFGSR